MDPNANLADQLRLARRIIDTDDPTIREGAAIRLAELVEALNDWLRHGGFLPEAWIARLDTVIGLHRELELASSLTELEALHDACERHPAGPVRDGLLAHYAWRLGLLDPVSTLCS